jgi:hypothetical protein
MRMRSGGAEMLYVSLAWQADARRLCDAIGQPLRGPPDWGMNCTVVIGLPEMGGT